MMVAPSSPENALPAGLASMLTPLLEKVGLRAILATGVAGMAEACITPSNPIAEVGELPAFSAVVMA